MSSFSIFLLLGLLVAVAASPPTLDIAMRDLHVFWSAFRDPKNGLWCRQVNMGDTKVCGDEGTRHYASAGIGMGLISDAVFTELGLFTKATGEARAMQTLESLRTLWPKEDTHGYYAHWVSAPDFTPPASTSTVDTAELALGALFAGNYFGGAVKGAAKELAGNISWTAAIRNNTIIGAFDFKGGKASGGFNPFNEYYTVSYLADIYSKSTEEPAAVYFDAYWGRTRKPVNQRGCPVFADAFGYELITGGCSTAAEPPKLSHFVSSFAPLFNHYMTKGFHTNSYYAHTLVPNWRLADMAYWDSMLNASSEVWGHKAKGHIWGCGAGPSPGKYGVDGIGRAEMIASPHIMAGFLDGANATLTATIKGQLAWMRSTGACMYAKSFADKSTTRVPWRCSVADPEWRADSADVVDFSTMVLGYASLFLPDGFYGKHVA